jgi:predicted kinase
MITHGLLRLRQVDGGPAGCSNWRVSIRIRSDVERKRLFGLKALQRSADHALDIYTPEATRRTFARLADGARIALQAGYPVIVDAAFLRRAERTAFHALAASLRVPFAILDLRASNRAIAVTGSHRETQAAPDASEADLAVLQRQFDFHEPLDAHERAMGHHRGNGGATGRGIALRASGCRGPETFRAASTAAPCTRPARRSASASLACASA